jgi:alpha-L-fucosidase 2
MDVYLQPDEAFGPGVVVVHGGSWTSGSRMVYVSQLLELLTLAGYNWFSIDYRKGPEHPFPAGLEDTREALRFIRTHAAEFKTDPNRIALLGEDSGAHLVTLLGMERPEGVAAVVSLGGFYDLQGIDFFDDPGNLKAVFGKETANSARQETLAGASPINRLSATLPPFMVVHGMADRAVPVEQAAAFCESVRETGSECTFVGVERGSHRPENWWPSQWAYKQELLSWLGYRLDLKPQYVRWSTLGPVRKDVEYGSYRDASGEIRRLLLDAYVPSEEGPHPAVVLVHGGGWEAGSKSTYLTPVFEPLARAGFAWFSIDYRLTPEFRNWHQLDDVRRAIRYLRHHANEWNIDSDRIALLGESAGAQLAVQVASLPCEGLQDSSDLVDAESCDVGAVVSFYGVYDFQPLLRDLGPRSMADRVFGVNRLDEEALMLIQDYSPLYQVHSDMPPILLIHGTEEFLWEQAESLKAKLEELRVEHDLIALEGAPHGMENWEGHEEWLEYKGEMVSWLKLKLMP